MKIHFLWLLLLNLQVFSQSYLNLHLYNGTNKNSLISSLRNITLSANYDQMYFELEDGLIVTENISDIVKLTLDDTALGEPLPVELSMFSAVINSNTIVLTWRTETEVSNYGFEVERSFEANYWMKIGFVEGNGNSNSTKEYSFIDHPKTSRKFYYRLKQIDTDGTYQYSNIVSVDFGIPLGYELKQNSPNPFNPSTIINYNLPADGLVTIKVYDLLGNEIVTLVNEAKTAGNYLTAFNGSELSSGVYICTMVAENFHRSIKMIMLK